MLWMPNIHHQKISASKLLQYYCGVRVAASDGAKTLRVVT